MGGNDGERQPLLAAAAPNDKGGDDGAVVVANDPNTPLRGHRQSHISGVYMFGVNLLLLSLWATVLVRLIQMWMFHNKTNDSSLNDIVDDYQQKANDSFCRTQMTPALHRALWLAFWELANAECGCTRSHSGSVALFATVRWSVEFFVTPWLTATAEASCRAATHLWTVTCWSLGDTIRFGCFAGSNGLELLLLGMRQQHASNNNDQGGLSKSITYQQQKHQEQQLQQQEEGADGELPPPPSPSQQDTFHGLWTTTTTTTIIHTSIWMAKWIRYTAGPILFPLGVVGEMSMLGQVAWRHYDRPYVLWPLLLLLVLWPLGFAVLMKQLLQQRRKFLSTNNPSSAAATAAAAATQLSI
ncbi:hypothetical protein ACA910_009833 [Epithemia clementina (nom. ined.)]